MICAGIDTHKDAHVLVIADELGREISRGSFAATTQGTCALAEALGDPAECIVVGIEGTGSYGAHVAAHLLAEGYPAVEVSRPKRSRPPRSRDKSDHADALMAAKRALAGEGIPMKVRGGDAEAIACLLAAYKRLRDECTSLINCAHGLIVSAPKPVRSRFAHLRGDALAEAIVHTRGSASAPEQSALAALKALARSWRAMRKEADGILAQMRALVSRHAPSLLALSGVGIVCAAEFVALAGERPSRIEGEAALARMTGAAPLEASSGRVVRHRLDRGGCRSANAALHTVVLTRMAHDDRTRAYVERRTREGLSKREIMRCLKRYVCREIYRTLRSEEERRHAKKTAS